MNHKRMKIFKFVICTAFCILFMCGVVGCTLSAPSLSHPYDYYGEREVGDFIVHFFSDDTCVVIGTTEQGKAKRFLVIPKQIEDSPVTVFGDQKILAILSPKIESEVLEKIYFENEVTIGGNFYNIECPNLKKFFCLREWKSHYRKLGDYLVYYPRTISESYAQKNPDYPLTPANVSYYYNYESAENYGYYWIDDYDYGCKIEFIPDEPIRDGYVFGGWFKEAECINEWNFDSDNLPEAIKELKEVYEGEELKSIEVEIYQETILYAKWIKVN